MSFINKNELWHGRIKSTDQNTLLLAKKPTLLFDDSKEYNETTNSCCGFNSAPSSALFGFRRDEELVEKVSVICL